ncbi:type IV pilus modification protein PilV [Pseudoxanthomonas kalamensis DSM 18571]|nr:type IV pilus modification protein PilV [Pseudoxanthomonas kalamensis DSM 18571]
MVSRSRAHGASAGRQMGVGLLEVMISVLIMGIGLLGIAAMQATALKNGQSSLERSQAVIQSYAILDAMRANRDAALAGDYNRALTCAPPGTGALAETDVANWITSLETTLGNSPNTCGSINCDGNGVCTVVVQWDDSRAQGNTGAGSTTESVTTVTQL